MVMLSALSGPATLLHRMPSKLVGCVRPCIWDKEVQQCAAGPCHGLLLTALQSFDTESSCQLFLSRCSTCCEAAGVWQVCLELLVGLALRNRDRIVLIWPLIHEFLNPIMTPNGLQTADPLTARVSPSDDQLSQAIILRLQILSWPRRVVVLVTWTPS